MAKIEIYIWERYTVLSLWTEDNLKRVQIQKETKRHLSLRTRQLQGLEPLSMKSLPGFESGKYY